MSYYRGRRIPDEREIERTEEEWLDQHTMLEPGTDEYEAALAQRVKHALLEWEAFCED